jgi:hypothetical protein
MYVYLNFIKSFKFHIHYTDSFLYYLFLTPRVVGQSC